MNFLVAGVVCIVAFAVGLISYLVIPYYEKEPDDSGNTENTEYKITSATFPMFFKKENTKQIVFLSCMTAMCGATIYISIRNGIQILHLLQQVVILLAFLSAMIIDKAIYKIPNILILVVFALGAVLLGLGAILEPKTFLSAALASVIGCCACLALFYALSRLTKEGVGMGDVKLIAVTGWIFGLAPTLFIVLASMILCSLYAIFAILGKKKNKNDSMPFGPFLFFGYIITLALFNI